MSVEHVPVSINTQTRASRLMRSVGGMIAFLLGRLSSAQPGTSDVAAFGKDRKRYPVV